MASRWLLREVVDGADCRRTDVGDGGGEGDGRGGSSVLVAAEGEKGGGGSGKSSDGGFWGQTMRNSFVVVLTLPTKVVNGCEMPTQPKAMIAMIGLHEDGCKTFGGEVATEIGCES
ncbi:hypothetical protein GW17_00048879 [Ensete ventricosum]|nr:hypothetical protein GW17_00048879 [Ensete ventricosum]